LKVDIERFKGNTPLKFLTFLDGTKFYLVGGCVRDLLLNRPLKDIDIVLERQSYSFIENFSLIFGAPRITRSQFLTLKIETPKGTFDVARTRFELYEVPGKLPKVYPAYDIVRDLKRRDFTINSMAIELWPRTFELVDPLGGFEDLRERILRVNKRGSFVDDPTRAFRAIRYRHRFGLSYDPSTEMEFENLQKSLPRISFTRIKNEIARIACEEKRLLMFKEIGERKILKIWDESFSSFNLDILEKLDKVLPRAEENWLYFLIPFGLENYFEKHPYNFRVYERRALELLFKPVGVSSSPRLSEIHTLLKDADSEAVKVWGILKGVSLETLEEYLSKRELLKNSVRLSALVKKLGNPQKVKKAYSLLVSALLDGEIEFGEEEQFLRKILPEL
jgi:tRNA nucleotidyltransferase (CCA-adding enzyme)